MSMRQLFANAAFDSETTGLLGTAFDEAWETLKVSGALAETSHIIAIRELLAKRIIERGRCGEKDRNRLVADALADLARMPPLSRNRISES